MVWDDVPEMDAPGKGPVQDWATGSHGLKARGCCFLPWPWGQRGAVCVSLHPGDGDTAKQEPRGRRVYTAIWKAVNPDLTTTTQIRWEMPQKITFLPVAQPWALGSASLDRLWVQPEGFTARIAFPFPNLWWETHHTGVCHQLLPSFPDPF